MRAVFWILLAVNLLLVGYLVYHFATYEHTPIQPGVIATGAAADSIELYRQRLAELEQSAEVVRAQLERIGKAGWPEVHARYELLSEHIAGLRAAIAKWQTAPGVVGQTTAYEEALSAYGRAGALYMALSLDTLPHLQK